MKIDDFLQNPFVYDGEKRTRYHLHKDEFFVPWFDMRTKTISNQRICSNYGTVISFKHKNPEIIDGHLCEKGYMKVSAVKYKDSKTGKIYSDYNKHDGIYFSFLYYMVVTWNTDERLSHIPNLKMVYDLLYYDNHRQDIAIQRLIGLVNNISDRKYKLDVHHLNTNKTDNRIENLGLFPHEGHLTVEAITRKIDIATTNPLDEIEVAIRDAFKKLNCSFKYAYRNNEIIPLKYLHTIDALDSLENVKHETEKELGKIFIAWLVAQINQWDIRMLKNGRIAKVVFTSKGETNSFSIQLSKDGIILHDWIATVEDQQEDVNYNHDSGLLLLNYDNEEQIIRFV